MVSQVIGGADEAEYQEHLGTLAAERGIESAELEASFRDRGMFCGTHEWLAERAAEVAGLGVGRLYVQQFAPLGAIDTDLIGPDIAAIRDA